MTTITFKEDVNIKDLYSYIIENQLLTEVGELSYNEVNNDMLNNYEKALSYGKDMFVNLK